MIWYQKLIRDSSLLKQISSEPEFYGDFRKIMGRNDFSDQFRKIIIRHKRIGYNMNVMRQTACLVVNPITVNNFAVLFNCTPTGRASDFWGSGPGVVLVLFGSVVSTAGRFVFRLALLFVYVFLLSFLAF